MTSAEEKSYRGASVLGVSPDSLSDPGPKNPLASKEAPSSEMPPSTDYGSVMNFWFPFSRASKRIQPGGWAREVTVRDLPIATTLAGVNMRLIAGAIRELHWHKEAEWAIMLYGHARITAVDPEGRNFVNDVKEGDLWFFPAGYPHSIQGLGPDGCEFLLVFDNGNFSENETLLLSDWMAHVPLEVLSKNFNLPSAAFNSIPQSELYIFPGTIPASLQDDIKASRGPAGGVPKPFSYALYDQKPNVVTKGGEARIVDSTNFHISTIAAALVKVHPGGLRELHWHPNADEWLYFISGQGRLSIFVGTGRARTMDFNAGDVGYIPKALGHYIENTGDTDLCFIEMFKSPEFSSVSLGSWLALTPPELVQAHTGISKENLATLPKKQVVILPE